MLKVIREDKELVAAHKVLAACSGCTRTTTRTTSAIVFSGVIITDLLQCLLSFMYQEPWGPGVCGGGVPGRDQNTADTVLPPPGGTGECEVVKVREFNSS